MSATETQAVPAGTWAVDPLHSTIGFAVGYVIESRTSTPCPNQLYPPAVLSIGAMFPSNPE